MPATLSEFSSSSLSTERVTWVRFSMISRTLPWVPPTVFARSAETTWMSPAILESDSMSLATLAASRTQVMTR